MPSDSKPKPSLILPVAVPALLLLASYVGLYYLTVSAPPAGDVDRRPYYRDQRRPVATTLFAPIHWLDRRIRPHVWEPE